MNKIKKILVSQPAPKGDKSPFFDLAEKHTLQIDFQKFIKIDGVSSLEYRESKVRILDHDSVIFNSRIAIDHFFRVCEESRTSVPDSMRYFCTSESVALYLQKHIVYRKRKIFFGRKTISDLLEVIKAKHPKGKFLLAVSDSPLDSVTNLLDQSKISYSKLVLYHTVSCDLKKEMGINDLSGMYDMIVLFTPSGVQSLFENFSDFKQEDLIIASFGKNTKQAAIEANLRVDIAVPSPKFPSMTMAIDDFIVKNQKK